MAIIVEAIIINQMEQICPVLIKLKAFYTIVSCLN